MTAPLLIVRNRLKMRMHVLYGVMILLSLALVGTNLPIGLLCLALFGGGYASLLYRFKKNPVALTVEEEGIRITKPEIFLPWAEIEGVGTWRFAGNEMVGFTLRDREAVWTQLEAGGMKRALLQANANFGYDLFVNSSLTSPAPADVATWIKAELLRRGASFAEA